MRQGIMDLVRVLVVEDQAELADDIADGLRDQGIGADVAYDGPAGIEKALMNSYDVVVLDRDLPQGPGAGPARPGRRPGDRARRHRVRPGPPPGQPGRPAAVAHPQGDGHPGGAPGRRRRRGPRRGPAG